MTIAQKIILSLIIFFIPDLLYLESKVLGYEFVDFWFWFSRLCSLFVTAVILNYEN